MEANRPIGCFECRHVMEKGVPLHLRGSNLVIEEQFENDIGWDIGTLDGAPFIAEDYVFGMKAFLQGGRGVWLARLRDARAAALLGEERASSSGTDGSSGVLQGMEMAERMPAFEQLPRRVRHSLGWGTRFRIATFAAGAQSADWPCCSCRCWSSGWYSRSPRTAPRR